MKRVHRYIVVTLLRLPKSQLSAQAPSNTTSSTETINHRPTMTDAPREIRLADYAPYPFTFDEVRENEPQRDVTIEDLIRSIKNDYF